VVQRLDDEPRQALQAPADRPPWDGEATGPVVRPDDGVLRVARPDEGAAVDPLRLDELELPPQVRTDEGEHQSPIGTVVLQDPFRERRAVGRSAPSQAV
jgi:hypothetical protein